MLKFLGKQSGKKHVEEARSLRVDMSTIESLRAVMSESGAAFTVVPGKSSEKLVYAGDFSSQHPPGTTSLGPPIFSLEYKRMQHMAFVKHGQTGEVVMMLVQERGDNGWYDENRAYASFGGNAEARLYLNGSPVGVNYSKSLMDVAPRYGGEERAQLGASLVELVKARAGNSLRLFKRKGDGTAGAEVAAFTKLKGGASVFCVLAPDLLDPLTTLVMAWFAATVDMGTPSD